MKRLMHILFLSCLKATELIEKKINFKLSSKEKIKLKMHKLMCNACSNYEKQSVFIDKNLTSFNHSNIIGLDIDNLKAVIKNKLTEQNN